MAAQEYYLGTQAAQELQGSHPPNPYQSQPPKLPQYQQQLGTPSYANTPPPSYSAQPQGPPPPPNKQFHGYLPHQAYPEKPPQAQAATAPYPQTPPAGYYPFSQPMPQPQRQPSNYLGVPLQQQRSHSQPPRVHFADDDSDRSTSLGSISDDEYSPRRHHHHHRHHHSNSSSHRHGSRSRRDERAYDSSDSSDRDRDRTSSSSRHRHHKPHRSHSYEEVHKDSSKTLDTFLGAGAGTIIGDVIFPGLGTAAGLVLGGYGGRKYAQDKLRSSHEGSDSGSKTKKRHHGGSRRAGDDGWDEKTRTYRKGAAVR